MAERFATRRRPAYLEEGPDGWRPVSWDEAAERVDALARGLLARGVGNGDAVAVISRLAGRVDPARLGDHVDRRRRRRPLSDELGGGVRVHPRPLRSRARLRRGRRAGAQARLGARLAAGAAGGRALRPARRSSRPRGARAGDVQPEPVAEDDLATLIYTSGTTGPPKGCMLTHKNLVTAAMRVRNDTQLPGDIVLLFLPLAHSFARLAHQAAAHHGATLAFVADVARVPEALAAGAADDAAGGAARLREDARERARRDRARGRDARAGSGSGRSRVGARREPRRNGGRVPPILALKERIADRLVFAKVRERLGGRLRLGVSGAAPLSEEVMEFFHSLGVPVIEGYGLTETSSSADASTTPTTSASARSAAPSTGRGPDRRRRRDPRPQRHRLRRLLQGSRGDRGGVRPTTAGSGPATSARSTRTASSRSPTARRTSSSPPAARTSRRRTSRTRSRRRASSRRRSSSATGGRTSPRCSRSTRRRSSRAGATRSELVSELVDDVNRDRGARRADQALRRSCRASSRSRRAR